MLPAVAAVVGLLVLGALWLSFAPGPRRRRAWARAEKQLAEGNWARALELTDRWRGKARLSAASQTRLGELAARCHESAAEELIREARFEEALDHLQQVAELRGQEEPTGRARAVNAMLAEAHRLFSLGSERTQTDAVLDLLKRVLALEPTCAEASFWQALCRVRLGEIDTDASGLMTAHQQAGRQFIDPPMYLGLLLQRQGKPQEALRYLSEANRVDPGCPMVACLTGISLVATVGDSAMAVRTLQRGLGARGLALWKDQPERAWVEGFPEQRSFVRRLATQHRYVCPLLGPDLTVLTRLAQTALAQAHYRLGAFEESAAIFHQLLQNCPPTATLLRGLGLALARLKRYDEAYKHLRIALDMQETKDALTAGYLALCGALGKPIQADDRPKNVTWALRLLSRLPMPGNAEWAAIVGAVHTEACSLKLSLGRDELLFVADALAGVAACDADAAKAYAHLAARYPDALELQHALPYVRAATVTGVNSPGDIVLFDRTFQEAATSREFFTKRNWDFADAEHLYLVRAAAQRPGRFPELLGADYRPRGIRMLFERSDAAAAAGQLDQAVATIEVLRQLAPDYLPALDRLAELRYRRGERDSAAAALEEWSRLASTDPLPWLRRAVLEHERGDAVGRDAALDAALERCEGATLAGVAFLGARLLLQASFSAGSPVDSPGLLQRAAELLEICLRENPHLADATWCLAAVRLLLNHRNGLVELAAQLKTDNGESPQHPYLSAICHYMAGDDGKATESLRPSAANDPALGPDCDYLQARIHLRRGEAEVARSLLHSAADSATSPSSTLARALLGRLAFARADYGEALSRWMQLGANQRTALGLDDPLRQTALLAGLSAFADQRYESAADHFRQASQLALRDRRLAGLITAALIKAGQQLLRDAKGAATEQHGTASYEATAKVLAQAVQCGSQEPAVLLMLAVASKRLGRHSEARQALRKIARPDSDVLVQLGLLSLAEGQLAQAEAEFAQAHVLDPTSYPACANLLLVQLTQGKVDDCLKLLPPAAAIAADRDPADRRFLSGLHALLRVSKSGDSERFRQLLATLHDADEQRLLALLAGLGQLESSLPLLRALAAARPPGGPARAVYLEAALIQGKRLMDRCGWHEAARVLEPLAGVAGAARSFRATTLNLLGVCACLGQDFAGAIHRFKSALKLLPQDARLHHNLALAHEFAGELAEADPHWNRFFDLMEASANGTLQTAANGDLAVSPSPATIAGRLAFEGLIRLANRYSDRDQWQVAIGYLQRAAHLRPDDFTVLERLFTLSHQAHQPNEARRTLFQLRKLKPDEPLLDLYELELNEVKAVSDLDRQLSEIERIRSKHSQDPRVDERALKMVSDLLPILSRQCDQLTDQLSKIVDQVRNLPTYQINWSAVRDVMRDLLREFQKLRRATKRCVPQVASDDQRRVLHELAAHIERKMEACRTVGG